MSVISMLTATLTGDGAMTSKTSGIALRDILIGAVIAPIALLVSLVITELLSSRQGSSENTAAMVREITLTLLLTFCALMVFKVAQLL